MNGSLNYSIVKSVTHGEWLNSPENSERTLLGGAFDTRDLGDAQIFFAWKGKSGDGHQYLNQLRETGVCLAIVERDVKSVEGVAILKVQNSLQALHKLAHWLILKFEGKLVSITGSSGKTTAKCWLSHLLSKQFNLLSSVGSFNNHIGCPMTILNLEPHHNLLILEMGTSGLGEIARLSSIAPADISILLNVGHAHLGKFESREKIYEAKNEIFSHMRKNGLAVIPQNDPRIEALLGDKNKIKFGQDAATFSWGKSMPTEDLTIGKFRFGTPEGEKEAEVNAIGPHVGEVLSGLIAICYQLGMVWDEIEEELQSLPQEKGRSRLLKGVNESMLLDDTYNANPESVVNMLETICSVDRDQYIGIVGNLAEMDEDLHLSSRIIVDNIPKNLTHLFLGGDTGKILLPLIQSRYPRLRSLYINEIGQTLSKLKTIITKKTIIGVKGSRTSHMERFVELLQGRPCNCYLQGCAKLMMCTRCDQL